MREFIIDKAPGKDLIPQIIKDKSYDEFFNFYKIRVDWYGYPLIHDRFVSYGLFDDLTDQFREEKENVSEFIDLSILIAEQENDKRFLNSIFLILDFCGIAKKSEITPTQNQMHKIPNLVNRVRKLSFLPNMTTFWDQILDFLSTNNTFVKTDYLVQDDAYLSVINMDFPSIDNNTNKSCPITEEQMKEEIDGIVGEYEPLKFVRSAIIDSDRYWVWLYKNITGNIWSWYFTVKQDEQNKIEIERHSMHGGVNKTPEKLLLDYHYKA
jgi:hypothetical protein